MDNIQIPADAVNDRRKLLLVRKMVHNIQIPAAAVVHDIQIPAAPVNKVVNKVVNSHTVVHDIHSTAAAENGLVQDI